MSKTINLVTKYAKAVQERFYKEAITSGSFATDLDAEFIGSKTVRVFDLDTVELSDYNRDNGFGAPSRLNDNLQEFQMTQDKKFSILIDKGDQLEQNMIKEAGKVLKNQKQQVILPAIDKYRFAKWAAGAGKIAGIAEPTKSSIAGLIMDGTVALDNALVPAAGRTLYIPAKYYKLVKLSDEFTHSDNLTNEAIAKGRVGEFDGMPVVKVPDSYLPANVYFMIIFKASAISPVKLQDYKIHVDPQGYSGNVIECRIMYDAFVRGSKAGGIYVAAASSAVCAEPTISFSANVATMSSTTSGASVKYTTDGSDPRYSTTAVEYNSGSKPTIASGDTVRAYAYKADMYNSGIGSAKNS